MHFPKLLLSGLFVFAFFINTNGQTGPGGVGNDTSNLIWLQADELTGFSDGDPVDNWKDQSGNGNDFTQSTASSQPAYKTNRFNGKPSLKFDGTDDWMGLAFDPPESDYSQFAVFRTTSGDSEGVISAVTDPVSPNAGSHDRQFGLSGGNLRHRLWNQEIINSSSNFNDNAAHIGNIVVDSTVGQTLYSNGNSVATGTKDYSDFDYESGMVIGGHDYWDFFNGEIPELIFFDFVLNDAQRIIVENYLAAKYQRDISASGHDYYDYEMNHRNDVAGIGRATASATHTKAMSADLLQISNPGNLNTNDEYLLFGHDGGALANWTQNQTPSGDTNIQRINREWRLNETGDLGSIKFTIDTTMLPARPNGYDKFVIMVDNDGDFTNGAKVYELTSPGGDQFYERSGIAIQDGDYVTIGTVDPRVTFNEASSSGYETNTSPQYTVTLNYNPASSVTVDYSTADSTAVSSDDFTASSGTLTIPADNTSKQFNLTVDNDTQVESSEVFYINLSNPSGDVKLGTPSTHYYTIKDDDNPRKIYFSNDSTNGGESTSPESIQVAVNNVDNTNPTTVDYKVTGGTASGGGTDFTLSAGTLTIPSGNSSNTFDISINDDNLFEKDETIEITLSNPSNCNLHATNPVTHIHTITDNDSKPDLNFKTTSKSGLESVSPVYVPVELSSSIGTDATVDYEVTGGTASGSGDDYTLSNGTLTITQGDLKDSFSFTINDDAQVELTETIEVELKNPNNANLGSNTKFTYSIEDNDDFGHTGPAGVGNKDNNLIWLKADELSGFNNGDPVSSWSDQSGNGNSPSQSNSGAQPAYQSSAINGEPALRFDGSDDWLGLTIDVPETNFSQFMAFQTRNNDGDGAAITITDPVSGSAGSHDREFGLNGNQLGHRLYSTQVIKSGANFNDNNPHIADVHVNSNQGQTLNANGNNVASGNKTGSNFTSQTGMVIGGHNNWGYFNADIPEIIYYEGLLNTAQRIIVQNYLASKFGLSISNDKFSYDNNFGNEVAGIGREDADNFHLDAQGTSMVRINNPSSLNNGDYLLWGHDNGSADANNTSDIPQDVNNRLERTWRVDETGDVGDVKIHFDLSGKSISDPDSLVLLIDSDDGNFDNANLHSQGLTYNSGVVSFTNVSLNSGDWITVGTKSNNDPLPVELITFDATVKNGNVHLSWKTASEVNNDYFTIQRSKKGGQFENVAKVDGAGNSLKTLSYQAVDSHPYGGTSYYRLKQTDFDGSTDYSDVEAVHFQKSKVVNNPEVYPNPTDGPITLAFEEAFTGNIRVELRGMLGKRYSKRTLEVNQQKAISLPETAQLSKGVYLLICEKGGEQFRTKIVRQ